MSDHPTLKLCVDCKLFINNAPPEPKWWAFLPKRTSTDSSYQFCGHPSAREVVDGRPNYAHLERICGDCGPDAKNWVARLVEGSRL